MQNADFFIKPIPKNASVTMAYVPFQNCDRLYSPEQAISQGTLFPDLNKPFLAGSDNGGVCDD